MNLESIHSLFFIGAGGIGMSNLVRYFLSKGKKVAGYDKTPTALTDALMAEGAEIHFRDSVSLIPHYCIENPSATLVVRTPAVPSTHSQLVYFENSGFTVVKRAELLGMITRSSKSLCVAGTHGKTTTSSMLAHILHQSTVGCNAFLGGILKNYGSNLILSDNSPYTVIEADEYDRSFHWLSPYMSIITSTDPDHLDVYGTEEAYHESFSHYTSLIQPGGVLLSKAGIDIMPRCNEQVRHYSYGVETESDFTATNVRIGGGAILFDFTSPSGITINDISLGVPVKINVENATAAISIALLCGVKPEEIKEAVGSFRGAKRRFDLCYNESGQVLIDDYGHHPEEVRAAVSSVKLLYPDKKLTVVFQPHLYSRTADFAPRFAEALSLADELILLDIYPARELPMEGVTSALIFDEVACQQKHLCNKDELMALIETRNDWEVIMTLGAGDIDQFIEPIINHLKRV